MRTKENPWLLDYQINGDAHTSPASMIVAAVEASRHVLQSRGDAAVERVVGFNISDVVFHDSIQLNEEGQEIYTELLPAGRVSENRDAIARFQFHIFTVVDNEPMTACSGFLSLEQDHRQQISTTPSNTTTGENIEVPPQLFYNNWGLKGLLWGKRIAQQIKLYILTLFRFSVSTFPALDCWCRKLRSNLATQRHQGVDASTIRI